MDTKRQIQLPGPRRYFLASLLVFGGCILGIVFGGILGFWLASWVPPDLTSLVVTAVVIAGGLCGGTLGDKLGSFITRHKYPKVPSNLDLSKTDTLGKPANDSEGSTATGRDDGLIERQP